MIVNFMEGVPKEQVTEVTKQEAATETIKVKVINNMIRLIINDKTSYYITSFSRTGKSQLVKAENKGEIIASFIIDERGGSLVNYKEWNEESYRAMIKKILEHYINNY